MTRTARRLAALAFALLPALASAHALNPWFLGLTEQSGGRVEMIWKIPRIASVTVTPVVPCTRTGEVTRRIVGTMIEERSQLDCGGSLVGKTLRADGLTQTNQAMVNVSLADGRSIRALLTAGNATYSVPEGESALDVFTSYVQLGVEHLLMGWDHMLFVAGLVLLMGATRKLLVGVTSFTVGHSITLALASFGLLRIPQAWAELAIAASIAVLALELAQRPAKGPGALERRPFLLPALFGLLHGLGFAGALRDLGLPANAIPLALFSFNVGIELGQLLLIAAMVPALLLAARIPVKLTNPLAWVPSTAIGGLSIMWCIERALSLVP
jgi:hydrogenase/urease accessory protein HupE